MSSPELTLTLGIKNTPLFMINREAEERHGSGDQESLGCGYSIHHQSCSAKSAGALMVEMSVEQALELMIDNKHCDNRLRPREK
ncbi:hypothetical protein CEXT_127711 [Caerostris extrusa]|uniref:Uncharacterized protein n=1 Tax=Caerostris extrusa TaxID=172846 RepID=A0AAV4QLM5_CAEEX|nr:hypothetical protein CEXT_127711 [Caerostris extrusa]